jgi:hypothetical protein
MGNTGTECTLYCLRSLPLQISLLSSHKILSRKNLQDFQVGEVECGKELCLFSQNVACTMVLCVQSVLVLSLAADSVATSIVHLKCCGRTFWQMWLVRNSCVICNCLSHSSTDTCCREAKVFSESSRTVNLLKYLWLTLNSSGYYIYDQVLDSETLRLVQIIYFKYLFWFVEKDTLPWAEPSDWVFNGGTVCLQRGTNYVFKYNAD